MKTSWKCEGSEGGSKSVEGVGSRTSSWSDGGGRGGCRKVGREVGWSHDDGWERERGLESEDRGSNSGGRGEW